MAIHPILKAFRYIDTWRVIYPRKKGIFYNESALRYLPLTDAFWATHISRVKANPIFVKLERVGTRRDSTEVKVDCDVIIKILLRECDRTRDPVGVKLGQQRRRPLTTDGDWKKHTKDVLTLPFIRHSCNNLQYFIFKTNPSVRKRKSTTEKVDPSYIIYRYYDNRLS